MRLDNDSSDDRTLIEIEAEDRLGLLFTITQKLAELRLDIATARIATERGAAIDSFYVSYEKGGKITDAKQQERVVSRLRAAIDQTEAGG